MDLPTRLSGTISASRGNLSRLAKSTGLSHTAIKKIASRKTQNPGIHTIERIERALKEEFPQSANSEVSS